jgi:hypothetical protein
MAGHRQAVSFLSIQLLSGLTNVQILLNQVTVHLLANTITVLPRAAIPHTVVILLRATHLRNKVMPHHQEEVIPHNKAVMVHHHRKVNGASRLPHNKGMVNHLPDNMDKRLHQRRRILGAFPHHKATLPASILPRSRVDTADHRRASILLNNR